MVQSISVEPEPPFIIIYGLNRNAADLSSTPPISFAAARVDRRYNPSFADGSSAVHPITRLSTRPQQGLFTLVP
jgi:hypothetical protein